MKRKRLFLLLAVAALVILSLSIPSLASTLGNPPVNLMKVYMLIDTVTGEIFQYQYSTSSYVTSTGSSEVDPIFTASPAYGIAAGDITNWNGKLSSITGTGLDNVFTTNGLLKRTGSATYTVDTNTYLTSYTETDPLWVASTSHGIGASDIINWDGKLSAITGTALDNVFTSNGLLKRTGVGTYSIDTNTYENSVNKNAANGYAGLDAGSKIPTVNLGGNGADNTKYLRGDQTWATPSGGAPSGTLVLISASESETTGGATEQTKTYSLSANTYARIIVEFDYEVIGAANTMYEWTIAVEIPQSAVIHDSNLRQDATGTGDTFKLAGSYKASAVQTSAATLRARMTPVTAGSATARILSMRVYGVTS